MLVIYLSLMPFIPLLSADVKISFLDKMQHTGAYCILCFTGLMAYHKHAIFVATGLFLMGAIIEMIQYAT